MCCRDEAAPLGPSPAGDPDIAHQAHHSGVGHLNQVTSELGGSVRLVESDLVIAHDS